MSHELCLRSTDQRRKQRSGASGQSATLIIEAATATHRHCRDDQKLLLPAMQSTALRIESLSSAARQLRGCRSASRSIVPGEYQRAASSQPELERVRGLGRRSSGNWRRNN
jgi:hypothetical protein